MAQKDLTVSLESAADGDGTFVVTGINKHGMGGHWGKDTNAYEALQIMLKHAGGIKNIAPSEDGKKAIRFLYIPHKPDSIDVSIHPVNGDVSWNLK